MADNFISKKVSAEPTLGEKLRSLRRRRHLTLEKAEEETRVRLKYLEALEKGTYGLLPADVYAIGFLIKYIEFLGGNRNELVDLFREERGEANKLQPLAPTVRLYRERFILTPRLIILIIIFVSIAGLIGYIFYSVRQFTSPPNLEISSPSTETIIHEEKVELVGKTDEGATVTINDQTIYLDDRGNFKEMIKLQPGLNNIEVKAVNRIKKENVKVVKILAEF